MASNLFRPYPWQIPALNDKAAVLLLTGSAGGGKSRLAGEKIHAYMMKYPNATGAMLRKVQAHAQSSIVPFMKYRVIGSDTRIRVVGNPARIEYPNGSMLWTGGLKDEEQRERLRSMGKDGSLDIAWIEEANRTTRDDFNEVIARMRGKAADWRQIILSTNPDHPRHWILKELWEGGLASVYVSNARDNPANPPEYLDMLDMLTGVQRDRLRDGKWVQSEGAVYEEFNHNVHLVEAFDIPPTWRRIRAIDFGYTHPFVCQWWALDPDGRAFLYREIYETGQLVEDLAARIVVLSTNESIEATVADHDAEGRATLERYGVPTVPATKAVSPGIQAVKQRLKVADDGKPRLFLMRGALVAEDATLAAKKKPLCTIDAITGYVWSERQDRRTAKEIPVKADDDGMDAMRYAVVYFDGDPMWRVERVTY